MTEQESKQRERVSRARRDLVVDDPLHGVCLLSLNLVADEGVKTAATDGTDLWYAPSWVAKQSDRVLRTVLAHEVLHCELLHPFRMAGKDEKTFNDAADHVVNLALLKTERANRPYYELWDGALCDPQYEGLSVEAVYAKLRAAKPPPPQPKQPDGQQPKGGQQPGQQPQNGQGQGQQPPPQGQQPGQQPGQQSGQGPKATDRPGGVQPGGKGQDGKGKPDGQQPGKAAGEAPGERERLGEGDWAGIVEQTTRGVRRAGKLSGDVERAIKDSREAVLDWRALLREHITNSVPDDVSWLRPDKRYLWRGIYLPGAVRENVGYIGLAIDTSGSVSPQELQAFAAEAEGILREARPERLDVVYCNTAITGEQSFEPDDDVVLKPRGGGGTAFKPVFDRFETDPPLCLVYVTDLATRDWHLVTDPGYPVLWCTPAHIHATAPFGDTVRLDAR